MSSDFIFNDKKVYMKKKSNNNKAIYFHNINE